MHTYVLYIVRDNICEKKLNSALFENKNLEKNILTNHNIIIQN